MYFITLGTTGKFPGSSVDGKAWEVSFNKGFKRTFLYEERALSPQVCLYSIYPPLVRVLLGWAWDVGTGALEVEKRLLIFSLRPSCQAFQASAD